MSLSDLLAARIKIKPRTRTRTKFQQVDTNKRRILLLCLLAVLLAEASEQHVIKQSQNEEEVELLRPSTATATTTTSSKPSSTISSSSQISSMKNNQREKPHIYRIRAAPMNGNLAPPIRVLPTHQTFGVRAQPSSTRTSAKLQQQHQDPAPELAAGCAKAQDEQDSAASSSSSSISATSQVLRFSNSSNNNSATTRSSIVQRLGEFEETPSSQVPSAVDGRQQQRPAILLANQSPQIDQQPSQTTNSIVNLIDEYDSKIITNKTRAQLSCDSGEMILRLNFSEPFKGIVYPDNNRLSPCRFFGDGHHNYELRLPLRGCGTKQAAQRVFVNDVIVRFHKTLELEEDEVKTLICRYPPPLTAASTSTAQRPSLSSGGGGEQENGPNQFEFIEHTGRQPSLRQPAELSDTLQAVTPPGGHQSSSYDGTVQELASYNDRPLGNLFQQPYSGGGQSRNGRPNADLIDQRSSSSAPTSAVPDGLGNLRGQPVRATGGLAGYFERLSSIELLFLISSFMFLVLLALGLAGGYFCFRRQAASERQASAILRRKRRFLSGSGMLAPPPTSANLLHGPTPLAPPSSMRHHPHYYHHQRRQQQQQHHHHHYPGPSHPAAPPTTSSPGSDLSGRGLLAATSNHSRHADEQQHRYMFNNQAFVPDPNMMLVSKRHKGPVPPPKPVLGRRGDSAAIYGHHYHQHQSHQGPVAGRQSQHRTEQRNGHHLYSMNDVSAKYNQVRPATQSHGLHRAHQVYVDHEFEPARGELSRAKSLTCVAQQPDCIGIGSGSNRQTGWTKEQPLIGGTLSRYQMRKQNHDQPAYQRHRAHHYLPPSQAANKHLESIRDIGGKYGDAWLHVSSDSEVEPNNNNNETEQQQHHHELEFEAGSRGKLLLKSVEDSYITKFTEIEEKEYTKRDSLRPLGLTEWREKVAEQRQRKSGQQLDQSEEASSYKSSSASSSSCGENDLPPGPVLKTQTTTVASPNSPDDGDGEYRSTNTNLRSLTELDVNFAKSLLRTCAPKVDPQSPSEEKRNSPPKPSDGRREAQKEEEEDLIVSPEYDLADRLELADEPTGAAASRNSVSYV